MNMMNMDFKRKLPIPMETKEMYPLSDELSSVIERRTAELKAIFEGESDKMALIIGPCSADNEDSVLDYVSRLVPVQEKVADKLLIVPRFALGARAGESGRQAADRPARLHAQGAHHR